MSCGAPKLATAAEQCLAMRFDRTKKATKKMAGFVTAGGRRLALQRERTTAIYVWVEGLERTRGHTRFRSHAV